MSFIILLLIFFLIYACLATYGSILKVAVMNSIIFGMTVLFTVYGIIMFGKSDVFSIVGTDINPVSFIHVCVVWFGADLICAYRIFRNYNFYLEVNGSRQATSAEQAQE